MSKFTVIEGGGRGPPDRHSGAARYHLEQAIIEILRSLVRGYDAQGKISRHLAEFSRELNKANASLDVVVGDAISELHKELDHQGEQSIPEQENETIVLRALQVAAEAMAVDPGAKGRLSGTRTRLQSAIEHKIVRREQRAREWQKQAPRTSAEKKAACDQAMATVEELKRQSRKASKSKDTNSDDDKIT